MDAVPPSPGHEHARKLRALFEAALELHPDQRQALLDAADPALRAEVERLLEIEAHGGGFLERLPVEAEPETAADGLPDTVPALAAAAHQRIGPYRLDRIIGEGGMGTVWLATQEKPIRRTVALKVIKLGMDTKEVIARFESERQALALMDHPNIARVLDAGAAADGRPYFVMEFVRGVPITQYCDENRLPNRERMELFIEVCHAVQHAHQRGVIHRDLKPSNVLVAEQDGKPVPKVIDFGIAKAMNQRLTEHTLMTRTGALIGTPEYMSPEQAETDGLDVAVTTDVYSLGVVLYELLAGLLPFDPKVLRKAGYEEMRRIIREQEPPTPARRLSSAGATAETLAERRGTHSAGLLKLLRGDVGWITLKALEKDRRRRYQSPAELAADVERHLRDQPVLASPPSVVYRLRKAVRRRRKALMVAVGVLAALSAGGAVAWWNRPAKARPFDTIAITRLTSNGLVGDAAISPDGKTVAFEFQQAGRVSLRLRAIATEQETAIVEPFEGDIYNIRYSSDGQNIYYSVMDKGIFRISSTGGLPIQIFDRSLLFAVAPDGKQLAGVMRGEGEILIGLLGTDGSGWKKFISRPYAEADYFRGQSWLPDGKTIAAFAWNNGVLNFEAYQYPEGTRRNMSSPGWRSAASSVWLSDGKTLLFVGAPRDEDPQIWRIDFPAGTRRAITNAIHYYHTISLSADNRTLAAVAEDWNGHLWTIPIGGDGVPKRLTGGLGKFATPSWTNNGDILFEQEVGNLSKIGSIDETGGQQQLPVTASATRQMFPAPCGPAHLLFTKRLESRRHVMVMVRLNRADGSAQVLGDISADSSPTCTSDGSWALFIDTASPPSVWKVSANGSRRHRIGPMFALPAMSPDEKRVAGLQQTSKGRDLLAILDAENGSVLRTFEKAPTIGNSTIRWTRDGSALTYIDRAHKLVRVPADGGPTTVLYDFAPDMVYGFDWSPDGKRIVVARGQVTRDIVLIRDTTKQ